MFGNLDTLNQEVGKTKYCHQYIGHHTVRSGKNGPPDHFMPISFDRVKVLVFGRLHYLSHSGEGWSMVPVIQSVKVNLLIPEKSNYNGNTNNGKMEIISIGIHFE